MIPYRSQGQSLRRTGLVVEALCLLGLLSVARGNVAFWKRAGIDPSVFLTAGLAVGMGIWAWGSYLIMKTRRGG